MQADNPWYNFYTTLISVDLAQHEIFRTKVNLARVVLLLVLHSFDDTGWMSCDFTSFATVFKSYQDGECVIMEGFVR